MVKFKAKYIDMSGLFMPGPNKLMRLTNDPSYASSFDVVMLSGPEMPGSRVDFVTQTTPVEFVEFTTEDNNAALWNVACVGPNIHPGIYLTSEESGFGIAALQGDTVFGYALDEVVVSGDVVRVVRCAPFML